MKVTNPLIETSLTDCTKTNGENEVYERDCHLLPICKSYGHAGFGCLAGAYAGNRCTRGEKMQIVIANDANPNATFKYDKPSKEDMEHYTIGK